ncbi:uncharacterized protein PG998_014912 [Apiospora kogelbergensis]|uniref:uncharacterized protein n=1 Tax=Apiospora kogelbergensis TaxID=1337665 RepID=UPI00312E1B9B
MTSNYGVDVVMNSLPGDLLEECWRLLSPGETFIEIGKKDIIGRARRLVETVAAYFMKLLSLSEQMDPARPLSVYGMDSLSALESRNRVHVGSRADNTRGGQVRESMDFVRFNYLTNVALKHTNEWLMRALS